MLSGRARCKNCWVKHYRCLLILPKEVVGGKGGPSGSHQVKAVAGSQAKGSTGKARKAINLGKSNMFRYSFAANGKVRTGENQGPQMGPGCQHRWRAVHVAGGPLVHYQCTESPPQYIQPQSVVDPL